MLLLFVLKGSNDVDRFICLLSVLVSVILMLLNCFLMLLENGGRFLYSVIFRVLFWWIFVMLVCVGIVFNIMVDVVSRR